VVRHYLDKRIDARRPNVNSIKGREMKRRGLNGNISRKALKGDFALKGVGGGRHEGGLLFTGANGGHCVPGWKRAGLGGPTVRAPTRQHLVGNKDGFGVLSWVVVACRLGTMMLVG